MGLRHTARRMAAQALYALDMNPQLSPADAATRAWEEGSEDGERAFLDALVLGAWRRRAEIDQVIERVSRNWKLSRMDRVDRSILRLGVHELLDRSETPAPVILDESIELAKEFGAPGSPAFVNGILDRVAREVRPTDELHRPGGRA
jgi:N utilization substance protein B